MLLTAVTWTGGGDGSAWTDPLNWSNSTVPTSSDDVTISVAQNPTIRITAGNRTVHSLTSDEAIQISGGSLTLSAASTINNNLSVSGGSLTVQSTLSGTGSLINLAGGTVNLYGATINTSLENHGTAITNQAVSVNGALWNASGALLQVVGDYYITNLGLTVANGLTNDGTIELQRTYWGCPMLKLNAGVLANNSGATLRTTGINDQSQYNTPRITGSITNLGSLDIQRDTTIVNTSATFTCDAGAIGVSSGITLTVSEGTAVFGSGTTLLGSGQLAIISSNNNGMTVSLPTDWELKSSESLAVSMRLANLNGPGKFIVDTGRTATLTNVNANADITLSGTLNTRDLYNSISYLRSTINGAITVNSGSLWSNSGILYTRGFVNHGTFDVDYTLVSSGTLVNAADGVIRIGDHQSNFSGHIEGNLDLTAGTVFVGTQSTLNLYQGTTILGSGAVFQGDGTLDIAQSVTLADNWIVQPSTLHVQFSGDTTISGPGTITIDTGASLTFSGGTNQQINTDVLNKGTLTSGGKVWINGAYSFTNGSVLQLGNGTLTVPTGFTNHATIKAASGISGGLTITSGTLVNASDGVIDGITLTGTLDNQGTFKCVTATGYVIGDVQSSGAIIVAPKKGFSATNLTLNASGTLSLGSGSTLSIDGVLTLNDNSSLVADPKVSFNLARRTSRGININGNATFVADPTDEMYMGSVNWLGSTTSASLNSFPGDIEIYGPATANNPILIEAMSRDLGNSAAGFNQNSAMGTLYIAWAEYAKLVDNADNAAGSDPEALYVNQLKVEGTVLDLNGLHVYARQIYVDADSSIINGTVTKIADGGPVSFGSTVAGSIASASEVDDWTFYGRAGRAATVVLNPGNSGTPSAANPLLLWAKVQLLDSNGNVLGSLDNASASSGSVVTLRGVTLPTDGIYHVHVQIPQAKPSATGNYVLAVWDGTVDQYSLAINRQYTSTIGSLYNIDQWSFTGLANQQVQFNLLARSDTGIVFDLAGPNSWAGFSGASATSGLITLPANGTYTLTARENNSNSSGGAYTFSLQQTRQTELVANTPATGQFVGPDQAELFHINLASQSAMLVTLTDSSPGDINELYLKHGSAPTRSDYDYRFDVAGSANQQIAITDGLVGDWYVLAYSSHTPSPSNFSLQVQLAPAFVTKVSPSVGTSSAIISVDGVGFTANALVELLDGSNNVYQADSVLPVSAEHLQASFSGVPAGLYSVRVTPDTMVTPAVFSNSFQVIPPSWQGLTIDLITPSWVGYHTPSITYMEVTNVSTTAIAAPILVLTATQSGQQRALMTLNRSLIPAQGFWTSSIPAGFGNTIWALANGAQMGSLQPGETVRIPVYYAGWQQPWDFNYPTISFSASAITTDDARTINWSSLESSLRPTDMSNGDWAIRWPQIQQWFGSTWGSYAQRISEASQTLTDSGSPYTNNCDDLFRISLVLMDDANSNPAPAAQSLQLSSPSSALSSSDLQTSTLPTATAAFALVQPLAAPAAATPAPPAAPSNLQGSLVALGNVYPLSRIDLTWTDNSTDETGFIVDRATDQNFTKHLTSVTLPVDTTSYSATNLSTNTKYYFRVRSTNTDGDSANTAPATVSTPVVTSNVPMNDLTTPQTRVLSPYSWRKYMGGQFHPGVDTPLPEGTPLGAPFDGLASYNGLDAGGGNIVQIVSLDGTQRVVYMHLIANGLLDTPALPSDNPIYTATRTTIPVVTGQLVGFSGNTGQSGGPHTHVEYYLNSVPQNALILATYPEVAPDQPIGSGSAVGPTEVLMNLKLKAPNQDLDHVDIRLSSVAGDIVMPNNSFSWTAGVQRNAALKLWYTGSRGVWTMDAVRLMNLPAVDSTGPNAVGFGTWTFEVIAYTAKGTASPLASLSYTYFSNNAKNPTCVPPPPPPPPGPHDPKKDSDPLHSADPNDKIGPAGAGSAGYITAGTLLPYRIDFENDSTATAPAQIVEITDQLDSNVDWRSFELTEFGFGSQLIDVPAHSQHFQTTVPMTYNNQTFNVLIEGGINFATGKVYAIFQSIDPQTELPPDVLHGFLPPEDGSGRGMGYIAYLVRAKDNLASGAQIHNVADIIFDGQAVISTDQIDPHDATKGFDPAKRCLNTIDAGVPISSVTALPTNSPENFTVSWSGQDETSGSGIASYDVYVSEDGGDYTLWQSATSATSAAYTGTVGHSYAFYSVATDYVGHSQAVPESADTQTNVVAVKIAGHLFNDLNANGVADQGETPLDNWTVYLDLNKNNIQDQNEPAATPDVNGDYTFNNLLPNTIYRVRQVTPAGWRRTSPSIGFYDVDTAATPSSTANDFGSIQSVQSNGTVYLLNYVPTTYEALAAKGGKGSMKVFRVGGDLTQPLTVSYTIGGTANADVNFSALSGTITIPARQSYALINVAPLADNTANPTLTVTATLINDGGPLYSIASNYKTATVSIIDDAPTVYLLKSVPTVYEGTPGGKGQMLLYRTGATTQPLTVHYSVSGTANDGVHYQQLTGTATFVAGKSIATIDVKPVEDGTADPTLPVTATLQANSAYNLVNSYKTATVNILDDAPTIYLWTSKPNAYESGLGNGQMTLYRTAATTNPLTVNYTVSGTANNATHYQQLTGSVTFAAGKNTATINVVPVEDGTADATLPVTATLATGSAYRLANSSKAATVNIIDAAPTIYMWASQPNAYKSGKANGKFAFYRTGSTANSLTVDYSVLGGTAASGTNFTVLTGHVTFNAGQLMAYVDLIGISNPNQKTNLTVIVGLSQAAAYRFGSTYNSATLFILNA